MEQQTLTQIIQSIRTELKQQLSVANPAIDALSSATGGAIYSQQGYQNYLFRQLNPETADEEWLAIWGQRLGVIRIPATTFIGTVQFTGTGLIPENVELKSASGKLYLTTSDIDADQPLPIAAIESGIESNLAVNDKLSLTSPLIGIDPDNIPVLTINPAVAQESLESWRSRILQVYLEAKRQGQTADYEYWAQTAHPDVDKVWVFEHTPYPSAITLRILVKGDNPVAEQHLLDTVKIFVDEQRPLGVQIFVSTAQLLPVAITISGVNDNNQRQQIQQELNALSLNLREPNTTLTIATIYNTINAITTDYTLISPTTNITAEPYQVMSLGVVTWQ